MRVRNISWAKSTLDWAAVMFPSRSNSMDEIEAVVVRFRTATTA
jgi:hypothetical protein